MKQRPIRVLCVDDHPLVVEGIRARIKLDPELELVGELKSADDLVREVKEHRPDVVLMDIAMPGLDPFAASAALQKHCPETRTIFLSAHIRDHYLDAAFRARAWGYLYKGDDIEEILHAVRRVMEGEYMFSPRVLERMRVRGVVDRPSEPKGSSKLEALSPTEMQILCLMDKGLSRARIAQGLHRSVKTVDTHRCAIMKKLDIYDRAELALFAVREGLVDSA